MPRDLTFEAIKLLSQRIVSNPEKIPEGEVFRRTSCMNPEDAEFVGVLMALKKRLMKRNPERAKKLEETIALMEDIGISKWVKGELTHLGFRAGLRYQENIDLATDMETESEEIDESAINASSSET